MLMLMLTILLSFFDLPCLQFTVYYYCLRWRCCHDPFAVTELILELIKGRDIIPSLPLLLAWSNFSSRIF